MRRNDVITHIDAQGESQLNAYRLRLLHPNALQLGNLSISWNPASGQPVLHSLKIHRGGEVIDVAASARFEILRRENQLEMAKLDGILTAVLQVADLRVGDELEFAVTNRISDPTLAQDSAGLMALGHSPAPGRHRMELSWEAGMEPRTKLTPDLAKIAKTGPQSISLQFDNPPLVSPPAKAPKRYQWLRVVEFSDFADWPAVSRRLSGLFATASRLAPQSPLRAEVQRIATAHANPLDRAAAALKLVQRDVRYVYVGLNAGNLTPASAEETWQRRYGDCKAKTALLLALLRELGVDAEAVVVDSTGNDDGMDSRLPSPRLFDHVLVRARIAGQAYYLDGTLPAVATPATEPVYPLRWLLALNSAGSNLEAVPWAPPKLPDEINVFEMDASKGFDQPAQITSIRILRGVAGLQQHQQLSGIAPNDLLSSARQSWVGQTWQTIDTVDWHYDEKARASVLMVSGQGLVDWHDDGDGERSTALAGGGFSPPDRRVRAAEQDQSLPFANEPEYDCRITTLRLPANTRAGQWTTKPEFDQRIYAQNYYRAFELRGGVLRMVRGLRVEQREIDAAQAKLDNDRLPSFDNSMAWVSFRPSGWGNHKIGSGRRIPTTAELAAAKLEWTGEELPCLGTNSAPASASASPPASTPIKKATP